MIATQLIINGDDYENDENITGVRVTRTDVYDGVVPPNSYIQVNPFARMARPEFYLFRKANQLPLDEAVRLACELLSRYDTCRTSSDVREGTTRFRDEPHMTVSSMAEYLKPVGDTAEGDNAAKVLAIAATLYEDYEMVLAMMSL